jgi:hypothetical protein
MAQSKYNRKLTRRRYRKLNRKTRKGGVGSLKELATREIAHQMIKNKIPITELRKVNYPETVVKPIEKHMAATIIAQREKERPMMTNLLFLKNLIRKRGEQGEYTPEELEILNEYYMDLVNHVLPTYGDEPHYWISKADKRSKAELSKADLFDYIEPWDHANWG